MFDIGWGEMAIIAVVALVVLGPKELPHALKTFSHWMRAARKLGSEFQSGVNEIVRDAELDDAKRELQKLSRQSIGARIEKEIDPEGDLKKAINAPVAETKAALSVPSTEPSGIPEAAAVSTAAQMPPFPGLPPAETPQVDAPIPSGSPNPPGGTVTVAPADPLPAGQNESGKSVSA